MIIGPLPFALVNGATADAAEVMADLNKIRDDVNLNGAQGGVNSSITNLTGLTSPPGGQGSLVFSAATVTNIGDIYTATDTYPAPFALQVGCMVSFFIPASNAGATPLLNVAGTGNIPMIMPGTTVMAPGALKGQVAFFYDGAGHWVLFSDRAGFEPGEVRYFAGAVLPNGWVLADGATYSTASLPQLFAAIGYTYGGSGANFVVPDLRGVFLRGLDLGRGIDPARALGTFQTQMLVDHTHSTIVNADTATYDILDGSGAQNVPVATPTGWGSGSALGPTVGAENRPVNVALLPGIRAWF